MSRDMVDRDEVPDEYPFDPNEEIYLQRCLKCGAEMYPSTVKMDCNECRNPDCEDCPKRFKIAAAEEE